MRISDWSSDVCSSDLTLRSECRVTPNLAIRRDERVSLRCVQLVGIAPARSVRPFETAVPTARRDASEQNRVEPFDFVPVPIALLSHVVPRHPCRSEEHTSELQSLMRTSYALLCVNKIQPN